MPIRSSRNQYIGVNVHLNGLLQNDREAWLAFHDTHIDVLVSVLNRLLPGDYRAIKEPNFFQYRTEPGNRFYRPGKPPLASPRRNLPSTPEGCVPIVTPLEQSLGLDLRDLLYAVRIDRIITPRDYAVVAWMELLDPLGKPDGPNYKPHPYNLPEMLRVPRVEIDYAHRSLPLFTKIPRYPDQGGSHPYRIHVWPPTYEKKPVSVWQFGVDDPFPVINIPLGAEATLPDFNLGEAYNLIFQEYPAYGEAIDYAQLPSDFDSFSATDQQRIRRRMGLLAEAVFAGVDLDSAGPFEDEG